MSCNTKCISFCAIGALLNEIQPQMLTMRILNGMTDIKIMYLAHLNGGGFRKKTEYTLRICSIAEGQL